MRYLLVLAALSMRLLAGVLQPGADGSVPVCLDATPETFAIERATAIAGKIFADAGVRLLWYSRHRCPPHGALVEFSTNTPSKKLPGALAYSMPYEGTHIEIFWDRTQRVTQPSAFVSVLAHVLAHEIAHLIEGTDRHSSEGIMKARWDEPDCRKMRLGTLAFTDFDLFMLHRGLGLWGRTPVLQGVSRPAPLPLRIL